MFKSSSVANFEKFPKNQDPPGSKVSVSRNWSHYLHMSQVQKSPTNDRLAFIPSVRGRAPTLFFREFWAFFNFLGFCSVIGLKTVLWTSQYLFPSSSQTHRLQLNSLKSNKMIDKIYLFLETMKTVLER